MMSGGACTHEESWLLLPWLANGRLSGAERARIEQHVRGCTECTREVALQRLWCETLTAPERVTYAPGPSLRKLMGRIDGVRAVRPRAPDAPTARAADARSAWRPPGLAWAASFMLTVGLALTATAYRWSQPLYVTHTDAAIVAPGVLHVAFERSLPIGDAEQLLLSAGARVVEGPDASGVFGVAPVAGADPVRLRALAQQLRADARVRWVEPLAGAARSGRGSAPASREP
jgi:putative zinc finger protein